MNKLGILVLFTVFSFSQSYADFGTRSSDGFSARSIVGSTYSDWIYDWQDFSKNRNVGSIEDLLQSGELSPEDKKRFCENGEKLSKVLKARNALLDLNFTGAAPLIRHNAEALSKLNIQIDEKHAGSPSARVEVDGQTFTLGLYESVPPPKNAHDYIMGKNQRFIDIINRNCTEVPMAELPQLEDKSSEDELRSFL